MSSVDAVLDLLAERKAEKTSKIPMDLCYQIIELSAQDAATPDNIRQVVESFGFELAEARL